MKFDVYEEFWMSGITKSRLVKSAKSFKLDLDEVKEIRYDHNEPRHKGYIYIKWIDKRDYWHNGQLKLPDEIRQHKYRRWI